MARRFRHSAIFGALGALQPGESMRFVNDHDPLPLLDQLADGGRLIEARRFDPAIAILTRSIEIYPTAEAHTFRGWAYSHLDRVDEAIAECKRDSGACSTASVIFSSISAMRRA